MSEKVRVGVIGVGYMGEVHVIGQLSSNRADVVAISDVNPERLGALQATYGIPRTYTDYREMLEKEDLDGVVVATPDELHRDPVEAVAAAGKHLLLEKPIATTMADAEAIVRAVDQAGTRAVMGFSLLFAPDYMAVQQRFSSGELGVPTTAFMKRACRIEEARRLYGRCSVNDYLAVHDIAFLLRVMGKDVESIYTVKSDFRVQEEFGTADSYWNTIKWKNGAIASVLVTWGMPAGHPMDVDHEALLIGTRGSAQITLSPGGQSVYMATDERFFLPEVFGIPVHLKEADHFADVIQGRAEPIATLRDGLDVHKMIAAGDESVRTGKPVAVAL
jgi:UDP-N-acetylglucosamine 3-dehydrogenase